MYVCSLEMCFQISSFLPSLPSLSSLSPPPPSLPPFLPSSFPPSLPPSLPLSLPLSLPPSLPPSLPSSVFAQREGDLRLDGYGASTLAGRLEVYLRGQWGTVCGDGEFNSVAAKVACRQLGLGHAVGYHGTPFLRSVECY